MRLCSEERFNESLPLTFHFHCSVLFRYFLTATLAPRMNVDNGIKIFRYDGVGPIYAERYVITVSLYYVIVFSLQFMIICCSIEQCYEVFWLPQRPEVYPDRGRSPSRGTPEAGGPDDPASASKSAVAAAGTAAAPPAAYR